VATPKGHATDRPKLFLQPEREQLKRARLREELASIPVYFRYPDLLTDLERAAIRRRVRVGLSAQRWSKYYGGAYRQGATQIPPGLGNYRIGGRNDRPMNTGSMRGSGWLGANEEALRVIPVKRPAPTLESFV